MDRRGQRLAAVFLFGAIALNFPILRLVSARGALFGIPVIYLYLFLVWAVVIALMAAVIERSS